MAQQFSSCRERLQVDCRSECVAVVEVARLNSENVASEKKRNSLKLSGDRLHAVTCKKNPYLDMGGFNAHTQIV